MSRSVFINATSAVFPNAPVDNDNIEKVLGAVRGKPSRSRAIVLQSNQIKTRYYAIDRETRQPTHTNAQLTSEAVRALFAENPQLDLRAVELMCCGTSSPDVLVPAHGQMVQGHLADFQGEVVTTSGVCCSSSSALKNAYLSILAGDTSRAIVTGSETSSKFMRSEFLESESEQRVSELEKNPLVAFEHDFLRWMLSDGAGAMYLSDQPDAGRVNLRLNWIEGRSYANEEDVCMFGGGHRGSDGTIVPWKDLRLIDDPIKHRFAMNIHQDIRQLRDRVPELTVERPLTALKKKRGLQPGDYTWFLPHYSSHFFRQTLFDTLARVDFAIPFERWFTSLYDRGNVGSASILVFISELIRQKKLERGQKILCYVPESARFSVYYFELEAV